MKAMLQIAALAIAVSLIACAHPDKRTAGAAKSTGLVLQADEGERMTRRWGLPMTIKIDPVNGGSRQLLVGTEDLPPGQSIPVHKHSQMRQTSQGFNPVQNRERMGELGILTNCGFNSLDSLCC
jgi:hypothetical protein